MAAAASRSASKLATTTTTTTTTTVYHGDTYLGEVQVFPTTPGASAAAKTNNNNNYNYNYQFFQFPNNEIRINHLSPPSERCPPLSILQSLSPSSSVRCKILAARPAGAAAAAPSPDQPLIHRLHLACFHELKTAVVVLGNEELHLVAMPTKTERSSSCFWCLSVLPLLYQSCLAMLNMRCLSIVFDLDETLIVANSTKSFEDKIEALTQRIDAEDDQAKVSGMSAELKRYVEDRSLLKQYVENDSVWDSGKLFTCQNEEVPPPSIGHGPILRPVIRLQEKNIVLTRINPENRDTSVLVRLRPAWEELRSYLTAKGRKRFEVYVCTMAERDYALEIWRLLDPDAKLISSKQLLDRIVCVRSGCRKSLMNVFQGGSSHPKLSMVIDDRINVWDDKDQPHVHAVPAFAPYYAPQAETANALPVLCVARNVACSVRGAFFKEFDENFLRKIAGIFYEGDLSELPSPPDCSHFLLSEDTITVPNGNKDVPASENMNGSEGKKSIQPVVFLEAQSGQQQVQPLMRPVQGMKEGSMILSPSLSMAVLLEIGRRCGIKVDFRSIVSSYKELQFAVEALFNSERIGVGRGRTRKEAQLQAADNALHYLANHYVEVIGPEQKEKDKLLERFSQENENGFLEDARDAASDVFPKKEATSCSAESDPVSADNVKRLSIITSSIKDILSLSDEFSIVFRDCPPPSTTLNKGEYYFQVEVAGQVLGKAIALSREGARLQAAEDALRSLKLTSNLQTQKRSHLPRSPSPGPMKRPKDVA